MYDDMGKGIDVVIVSTPDHTHAAAADAGAVALKQMLDATFKVDCARGKPATASSSWRSCAGYEAAKAVDENPNTYWAADANDIAAQLEVDLKQTVRFNLVALREPVFMGQRVKQYRVEYWDGAAWQLFSAGTTIGYQKLDRQETVSASKVRLVIEDARAYPLISHFGVHLTPFASPKPADENAGKAK